MANMSKAEYEALFAPKKPKTEPTQQIFKDPGPNHPLDDDIRWAEIIIGKKLPNTQPQLMPGSAIEYERQDWLLESMKNSTPPVQAVEENGDAISQDFEGYTRKFVKQDWQLIDAIHLLRYSDKEGVNAGTANWSEMGCYKTSTGLWYKERKI